MEDFSLFGLIRPNYQTKMTKIQRNPRKNFSFFQKFSMGVVRPPILSGIHRETNSGGTFKVFEFSGLKMSQNGQNDQNGPNSQLLFRG